MCSGQEDDAVDHDVECGDTSGGALRQTSK